MGLLIRPYIILYEHDLISNFLGQKYNRYIKLLNEAFREIEQQNAIAEELLLNHHTIRYICKNTRDIIYGQPFNFWTASVHEDRDLKNYEAVLKSNKYGIEIKVNFLDNKYRRIK